MDYIMNNLSFTRSNQVDIELDDLANWDDLAKCVDMEAPDSGSARYDTPLGSGESEPNDMEGQDSGSVRYDTPLGNGENEPNDMEGQDSGSVRYDTPVTLRSDNMSPLSPLLLPNNASAPPPLTPNPALDNESLNNTPRQTDYMSVDAGAGPSNTASYAFTFSMPSSTHNRGSTSPFELLSPINLKTRKRTRRDEPVSKVQVVEQTESSDRMMLALREFQKEANGRLKHTEEQLAQANQRAAEATRQAEESRNRAADAARHSEEISRKAEEQIEKAEQRVALASREAEERVQKALESTAATMERKLAEALRRVEDNTGRPRLDM